MELGLDVFSGSYPYLVTQKGHASLYEYKMQEPENKGEEGLDSDGEENDEALPAKRRKLEAKEISIDLNDKKFVYKIFRSITKIN